MANDVTLPGTGAKIATREIDTGDGAAHVQVMGGGSLNPSTGDWEQGVWSGSPDMHVPLVQQYGDQGFSGTFLNIVGDSYTENEIIARVDSKNDAIFPWHTAIAGSMVQSLQLKSLIIADSDSQKPDMKIIVTRSAMTGWNQGLTFNCDAFTMLNFASKVIEVDSTDWNDFSTAGSSWRYDFPPGEGFVFRPDGLNVMILSGSSQALVDSTGDGVIVDLFYEWV